MSVCILTGLVCRFRTTQVVLKRLSLCIRASRYTISHRAMETTRQDERLEVHRREPRMACSRSVHGFAYCEDSSRRVWKEIHEQCAGAGVWDRLVEYIDDELGNIQALRVVSRAFVSEDSTATLCHLAFHEINILLDPFSNPRAPIWTRCIALYSRVD